MLYFSKKIDLVGGIYSWLRPSLRLRAIALALRVGLAFAPLIYRSHNYKRVVFAIQVRPGHTRNIFDSDCADVVRIFFDVVETEAVDFGMHEEPRNLRARLERENETPC